MSREIKEAQPLREVVIVVFLNDNGQMLLEQRVEDDAFKNQWTFPGGKIDPEDRLQQRDYRKAAAIRESMEEISLVPTITQPLDSLVGTSKNGNNYLFHVVIVSEWTGSLINNEPEKRKLDWLTLEEAKQKMEGTPVDRAVLNTISKLSLPHPTQQTA